MLLEQLAQNSTQTSSVPAPIPPKPFSLEASIKSNNTTQFEQVITFHANHFQVVLKQEF